MSLRAQKILSIANELIGEGLLTADQLAVARESQKNLGGDLGDILVRRGYLNEDEFNRRLARQAGVTTAKLNTFAPSPDLLKLLQSTQVHRWRLIPFFDAGQKLTVATADPFDSDVLNEARKVLGRDIDCVLASNREIDEVIGKYYVDGHAEKEARARRASAQKFEKPHQQSPEQPSGQSSGQSLEESIDRSVRPSSSPNFTQEPMPSAGKDEHQKKPAPRAGDQDGESSDTVKVVDELFLRAIQERASDLHLEPTRTGLNARIRVDGILETIRTFQLSMQASILSRVKILSEIDVAEHRIPQDGRIRLKLSGKELDVRVATYPTIHGEAAAIRLLARDNSVTLDDMGFLGNDRKIFEKLIESPHGIFLVTGPTGSGKTTTLYTALQRIDRQKNHVLTVEDPVENEIDGAAQTQINTKAGVTFPVVLRAMLREDPDVIMVGEIRDQETAEISVRAAMTGHLVLSTLHTNTAIGAIARLIDLGLETYLISSTLLGVMAQRLVRKICQKCKAEAPIPPGAMSWFGHYVEGLTAFAGTGCKECNMRGFKGRIGLFELVAVDDEFRVLINNRSPEIRLKEKAAAAGSRSLLEDGIEKIRKGITTVEEVMRVCGEV